MPEPVVLTDEELGVLKALYSLRKLGQCSRLKDVDKAVIDRFLREGWIIPRKVGFYWITTNGIDVVNGGHVMPLYTPYEHVSKSRSRSVLKRDLMREVIELRELVRTHIQPFKPGA